MYVDNDPIVLVHARSLLTSSPEGVTDYIDADVHDPDAIVRRAAETLQLDRPVAVMMLGILNFVLDGDKARDIVRRVMAAVADHRKCRARMWAAIQLTAVAAALAIAPFTGWGQAMEKLGDALLAWPTLIAAASSLALGWLALQLLDPPLRQL